MTASLLRARRQPINNDSETTSRPDEGNLLVKDWRDQQQSSCTLHKQGWNQAFSLRLHTWLRPTHKIIGEISPIQTYKAKISLTMLSEARVTFI